MDPSKIHSQQILRLPKTSGFKGGDINAEDASFSKDSTGIDRSRVLPVSSNRLSSGNSSLILFLKIDRKEVNWLKTNTFAQEESSHAVFRSISQF